MGDLGSAFSNSLSGLSNAGGGGTAGGVDTSSGLGMGNMLSDAALGSAIMSGSAFDPSGALAQTFDPTGSVGASAAINPPSAGTPAQQQGDVGGTQSGAPAPTAPQDQQPQQFAPIEAVRQLTQALSTPRQSRNPYQIGASEPTTPPLLPGAAGAAAATAPAALAAALGARLPYTAYGALYPTPVNTGELPYGGYTSPPGHTIAGPSSEVLREGEGGPAPTTPTPDQPAPDVSPTAEAQPTTPAQTDQPPEYLQPIPEERAPSDQPPPTARPQGPQPRPGPLSPGLGQLAQIALPLIAMALMGGMGGRRGGFHRFGGFPGFGRFGGFRGGMNAMRGFGGAGHPGGRHMWPYHHPTMGWRMFGYHPGAGWRPMHPSAVQGNPAILSQILGAGQQGQPPQQDQQPQQRPQPAGAPETPDSPPQAAPRSGPDIAFRNSGLGDNRLINALVGQESYGGQNIVSNTDRDSHGKTLAQGGDPDEISQGYFQIQNHPNGTWTHYATRAGVDVNKYPTPRRAPVDVQWKVAQTIPIGQWGSLGVVEQRLGRRINPNMTLGQVAQMFGGVNVASAGGSKPFTGAPGLPRARTGVFEDGRQHYPATTETGGPGPLAQGGAFNP